MSGLSNIVPILLILVVFWLVLIKPQNDERAAHEALLASLSKDDHVVTSGGIHGWIVSVDAETVLVEIAKGTRIVLEKSNIVRRIEGDDDKK